MPFPVSVPRAQFDSLFLLRLSRSRKSHSDDHSASDSAYDCKLNFVFNKSSSPSFGLHFKNFKRNGQFLISFIKIAIFSYSMPASSESAFYWMWFLSSPCFLSSSRQWRFRSNMHSDWPTLCCSFTAQGLYSLNAYLSLIFRKTFNVQYDVLLPRASLLYTSGLVFFEIYNTFIHKVLYFFRETSCLTLPEIWGENPILL